MGGYECGNSNNARLGHQGSHGGYDVNAANPVNFNMSVSQTLVLVDPAALEMVNV
jgi:hypothetical protein